MRDEFKTCLGCGGSYGPAALKRTSPSAFARSKYCGMGCFRASAAPKPSPVNLSTLDSIAAILTSDGPVALISIEDVPLVEGAEMQVIAEDLWADHLATCEWCYANCPECAAHWRGAAKAKA